MQETLLTTRLFAVEHRVYTTPEGQSVARDVVVHPGAVVVVPVLGDDRLVMIRNYRYTVEQEVWELPAGTREPGETPMETARRELEEETGYRASKLAPLMAFYTSPGFCTEWMHAFVAKDLAPVGQNLQGHERIVTETVAVSEARRRLLAGEFIDGKTIAVLGRYLLEPGE
ncbi:MAG: NUDIX hydrolase [Phycisphaerae bacterium]|jgi:ADP-ribose pyrophosphatase